MTDENKNIENNQEENQNREECNKTWWKKLLRVNLKIFATLFIITILITLYISFKKQVVISGEMSTNGEFRNASISKINDDTYLIIDGSCGNKQPELYIESENRFIKAPFKLEHDYYLHNTLKLKNNNILIVGTNFTEIFDVNSYNFNKLENTVFSDIYKKNVVNDIFNDIFFLTDNGNIILLTTNNINGTWIYYINSKDFSLINKLFIDKFEILYIKQINENEVLLDGVNTNYIYNLKTNSVRETSLSSIKNKILKQYIKQEIRNLVHVVNMGKNTLILDNSGKGNNRKLSLKYNIIIPFPDFSYYRKEFSIIKLENNIVLIIGGTCGNSFSEYPYNKVELCISK